VELRQISRRRGWPSRRAFQPADCARGIEGNHLRSHWSVGL